MTAPAVTTAQRHAVNSDGSDGPVWVPWPRKITCPRCGLIPEPAAVWLYCGVLLCEDCVWSPGLDLALTGGR